jgi:hypothetical protein
VIKLKLNIRYYFLIFGLTCNILAGQNKTIGTKEKAARENTSASHKAMLIPFEPKLYLSEIDHNINFETKLTPREIRNKFRDGLNEQLYKAFKNSNYNVVDLMNDTARYKKDIEGIYQYIAYDYLKVPDQENYKAPKKEKAEKKIEKGQLYVETNSEERFMHSRVTDARVVPLLYAKYHSDVFVFINQLDLKAGGNNNTPYQGSSKRRIVVHYTVYTYDAREINSGIAVEEFEPTLNNPKKIIDRHFSNIASTIVYRVNKGLTPASKPAK